MEKDQLFDEWPKVSFEQIENIEIDNKAMRLFYRSFFGILRLPESTIRAFITLLKETP